MTGLGVGGTLRNFSGTHANGNAHDVVARNRSRRFLLVQNTHATDVMYLDFGADAAAATGIKLAAGQWITFSGADFIPTERVSLKGTAAGTYVVKEG